MRTGTSQLLLIHKKATIESDQFLSCLLPNSISRNNGDYEMPARLVRRSNQANLTGSAPIRLLRTHTQGISRHSLKLSLV